jgi:hypothetical protein
MKIDRMILMPLVIVTAINTLFSALAMADDKMTGVAGRGEDDRTQPREWGAQLSAGYLPAADFRGMPGDAAITDYRIKIARNVIIDSHLTLMLGGSTGSSILMHHPQRRCLRICMPCLLMPGPITVSAIGLLPA